MKGLGGVLQPPGASVVQLPAWGEGRLVILNVSARQRWVDGANYPAFRPSARLARSCLRILALCGVGETHVPEDSPWLSADNLLQSLPLSETYRVVTRIGTQAHGASKALSLVLDSAGVPCAVVKTAATSGARANLEREAEILTRLQLPFMPKLILLHQEDTATYMILSALPASPLPLNSSVPEKLETAMMSVCQGSAEIGNHPWVARLSGAAPGLQLALASLSHKTWPVILMHGDFAPWNVLRGEVGEQWLVDWEYAETDGLPWVDRAFWILQTHLLVRRLSARSAVGTAARILEFSPCCLNRREAMAIVRIACEHALQRSRREGRRQDDPELRRYARCARVADALLALDAARNPSSAC